MIEYKQWLSPLIILLVMVAITGIIGNIEQQPREVRNKVILAGGY
jgi:hypothetical protein